MRYRIRTGDYIRGNVISSVATELHGSFELVYDNGKSDTMTFVFTTGAASAFEAFNTAGPANNDGYVVGGCVTGVSGGPKRGDCFLACWIATKTDENSGDRQRICAGYTYGFTSVDVGNFENPLSGRGHLKIVNTELNVAGNVAPAGFGAVTNTLRKLHAAVILYNADGNAATRTVDVRLRFPLGAAPTGFGGAGDVWVPTTLTLTLGEEGIYYLSGPVDSLEGFVVTNDNGTIVVQTTRTPLPILIGEADPISFIFVIAAGLAGDVYSTYYLVEEWKVL